VAPHVLVVGRGDDPIALLWALRAEATASMLAFHSALSSKRDLSGYERVIALRDDASADEWIAMAAAVSDVSPVTRVVAFEDRAVELAATIAAALDLPGHDPVTARNVHNKTAFRECLRAAGVQDIPSVVAETPDDIVGFAARHGWPVVVKPNQGEGSYGVTVVQDAGGAAAAFAHARASRRQTRGNVLIEAFLSGPQFGLEIFSEEGERAAVAFSQCFTTWPHRVIVGHVLPPPASPEDQAAMVAHTVAALDALGVRDGPSHVEVIMTARGPLLVEAHLRTPGDALPSLVKQVHGIDIDRLWARQLAGERILPRLRRRLADPTRHDGATALAFATPPPGGTLRGMSGIEDAWAVPGVVAVTQLLPDGTRIERLTGTEARAAVVKADRPEPADAVRAAQEGARRLRFDLEADQPTAEADEPAAAADRATRSSRNATVQMGRRSG